ncbi:MAG: hypothetical protein ACYC6V_09225 [Bacillota bacterium]
MRSIALEYDNESDVREEFKRLTQKLGLTGEFGIKPAADKWRLEIVAERDLGEATVAKFRGRVIEG